MPITPQQVGVLSLPRPGSWVASISDYVDHVLVQRSETVRVEEPTLHYRVVYSDFGVQRPSVEELKELGALYGRQGWPEVDVTYRPNPNNNYGTLVVELYPPPVNEGLETMLDQVRTFVAGRPVELLTRKDNSRKDSGVAYRPLELVVDHAVLDLHLSAAADRVVAASSNRPRRRIASQ